MGRRQPCRRRLSERDDDSSAGGRFRRRRPTSPPRSPGRAPTRDALTKKLVVWPSWFFARGDIAAGGAGDESPLVFDDSTLTAEPTHAYTYALNRRFVRPTPAAASGSAVARPVDRPPHVRHAAHGRRPRRSSIWRNPRVVLRTPAVAARPVRAGRDHRARVPGPILETLPAASTCCRRTRSRALRFGASPDGTPIGDNDFAAHRAAHVRDQRRPRGTSPSCTPTSSSAPIATPSSA